MHSINAFLLAAFVARILFFVFIYGAFYAELYQFTGLVGLGVALNGGVSARNSVLYARRYGRAYQQALMWVAIAVTLPFQFLRRLLRGEQRGIYLKVRGWRDALRGRPIPIAELGLE